MVSRRVNGQGSAQVCGARLRHPANFLSAPFGSLLDSRKALPLLLVCAYLPSASTDLVSVLPLRRRWKRGKPGRSVSEFFNPLAEVGDRRTGKSDRVPVRFEGT